MTVLTAKQVQFLDFFRKENNLSVDFYLSGGTVLAEYYFHHRLSEDLDFFTDRIVDFNRVFTFISKVGKKLNAKKVEYNKLYDRRIFYLHFSKEILKTEFTEYPFKPLNKRLKKNNLLIDSLFDLSVNKLFVICERFEPKDYVDLYFILKKYNLKKLRQGVKKKFKLNLDTLTLGSQLIKGAKLPQLPKLLTPVKKNEIEQFFLDISRSLKKEILKI